MVTSVTAAGGVGFTSAIQTHLQLFAAIDKSTTQLDIRLAFFLVFTLVTIASLSRCRVHLGAFLAGMVMKLLGPRQETQDKLTSLGYGFFISNFLHRH